MLCAPKGATGGIRSAVRSAERGVIWATIVDEQEDGEDGDEHSEDGEEVGVGRVVKGRGRVTQLLWNERVKQVVRDGLGTGLRYVPDVKGGVGREVVLMLDGKVWEPDI